MVVPAHRRLVGEVDRRPELVGARPDARVLLLGPLPAPLLVALEGPAHRALRGQPHPVAHDLADRPLRELHTEDALDHVADHRPGPQLRGEAPEAGRDLQDQLADQAYLTIVQARRTARDGLRVQRLGALAPGAADPAADDRCVEAQGARHRGDARTGLDTLEGTQSKLFEGGMIERAAVARALSVLAFGLHGCSMGSH